MRYYLVLFGFLATTSAWATLGQSIVLKEETSVQGGPFTIHTVEAGSTTVREYVTASGIVFGLAWNGLTHPDLAPLLGTYAGDYQQGLRKSTRVFGRRKHAMTSGSLVVEKWGHMRNLQGRAYDPALLPSGVNADEIK